MEQQDREGQEMQARQRLGQAFVVARQAPEPGRPGEAALHDPAAFLYGEPLLSGEAGHDFDPPRCGNRLDDRAAVGGIGPGQFEERTLELRRLQQGGSADR